jgi:dienelactone hydrolase
MRFLHVVVLALSAFVTSPDSGAQSTVVNVGFADNNGSQKSVEAVLTLPGKAPPGKRPAVVILHHAGGWGAGTTAQYATFLSSQGFATLEPRMFNTDGDKEDTYAHMPTVFGSLTYLAKRPDIDANKIALMGLSYGALLSLYAGTEWAHQKYQSGEHRYAAIAPFYPLCWVARAYVDRSIGKWKNRAFPESLMDKWAGIPLKIFAPGLDDYESRDSKSCGDFVAALPDAKQKSLTSVRVYPAATHGWDHGRTYTFYSRTACKGAGCNNTNESSPDVTEKAKEDLLQFLRQRLAL